MWTRRTAAIARHVLPAGGACGACMSSSSSASSALLAIAGRGQVWIDGEYRAAEGGRTLPVLSPRDGKPFAEIANASAADVDSAVAAARRCLEGGWGAASNLPRRIAAMEALAAAIREPATMAGLTELESLDCGKPLGEAEGDIEACAGYFDYFASIAPAALATEPLATDDDDFVASLSKEPVGVVGCVTPWNYPLMQAVLKVAPALVAGCTVVLKPAPNASLACVALGQVNSTILSLFLSRFSMLIHCSSIVIILTKLSNSWAARSGRLLPARRAERRHRRPAGHSRRRWQHRPVPHRPRRLGQALLHRSVENLFGWGEGV